LGDEAGQLIFTTMAKNPTVDPVGNKNGKERGSCDEDEEADTLGGGEEAIENEDEEEGDEEAKHTSEGGFNDLASPEMTTEGLQLLVELGWNFFRWRGRHELFP